MKKFNTLIPFAIFTLLFVGCSEKSYHDEMIDSTKQSLAKQDYKDIKKSYSDSLVDEKFKDKEFISILEDKSLGDILKEMEIIDGNFYYLKSSDILVPKSRIKIHNIEELNQYLQKHLLHGIMNLKRLLNLLN